MISPKLVGEYVGPDPKLLELVKAVVDQNHVILTTNRMILEANQDLLKVLCLSPLYRTEDEG